MHTWQKVLRGVLTYSKANSDVGQIASCTLGLTSKLTIVCDLELLCAFHELFLFTHFAYLWNNNETTGGIASFTARNFLVRYFIMVTALQYALQNKRWEEEEKSGVVASAIDKCEGNHRELQVQKINLFLKTVINSLHNHFKKWIDSPLFTYGLFSKAQTGSIVAHLI